MIVKGWEIPKDHRIVVRYREWARLHTGDSVTLEVLEPPHPQGIHLGKRVTLAAAGHDGIFATSGDGFVDVGPIDITEAVGTATQFQLRFRLKSDGDGNEDRGWFLDDLEVAIEPGSTSSAILVNDPPVLTALQDQTVAEGQLLELTLSARDPEGTPVTYSYSTPSGPLPGVWLDQVTGAFMWNPGFTLAGTYDVTFSRSGRPFRAPPRLTKAPSYGCWPRRPTLTGIP
jgi:hypothetical protein